MLKTDKLVIIGTSHISSQSVRQVRDVIEEVDPDIVAVELDKRRLQAVLSEGRTRISLRDIRKVGLKGWLFAMIGGWAERKLGKIVNTRPGDEMREAIRLARARSKPLALIDQDIQVTLRKFSKAFTWREKWRLFIDILKAFVGRKPAVKFDLRRVPSKKVIKQLTDEVKTRYPSVYRVLIDERNRYMARKLARLRELKPEASVVAVVGAGHEDEMMRLYKKYVSKRASKSI